MTWTASANGTITSIVSATTDQILTTDLVPGTYYFEVDTFAMAPGDVLELRIYNTTLSGGAQHLTWKSTYGPIPPACPVCASPPQPSDQSIQVAIRQTKGSPRAYPWKLLRQPAATGIVANWYVAPAPAQGGIGSDSNAGTSIGAPFATIKKASTVVTAGQTVAVLPGTYPTAPFTSTASGTSGSPITYLSTTKRGAVLTVPAGNTAGTMWINGGSGTTGSVGANVIIDGFKIDFTTYTTGTAPEGGIFCTGNNNVVRNCQIFGINNSNASPSNAAGGIQMDGYYGGQHMIVHDNLVYNIFGTGAAVFNYQCIYIATDAIVYNNICGNTSSDCISSWHGANAMQVFHNTCFNGNTGVTIASGGIGSGSYVTTGNRNCNVFDNICMNCVYGVYESASAPGSVGSNAYSNNCTYGSTTPYSLSVSTQSNNISGNPNFTNYQANGTGTYTLGAGSSCLSAGLASFNGTFAPTLDASGSPFGSPPSVGAYQA